MCGIIGYVGERNTIPVLLQGLKRMEYRGYDSAGVAVVDDERSIFLSKQAGKIDGLKKSLENCTVPARVGIGHIRWATHGEPSERNAHPFLSYNRRFAIAHNGIIENHTALRHSLETKGYVFSSDTDSEVIAHLIEYHYKGDFYEAVKSALNELWGAYGIVVLSLDHPDTLIAARNGSPVVIGFGNKENFVASDVTAFIRYTREILQLHDREIAVISADNVQTRTAEDLLVARPIETVDMDIKMIEKGGFEHFMLKEIHEQPNTIRDAFRGRIILDEGKAKLGGLAPLEKQLMRARRLILTGCGTSWHAALIGELLIEELTRIPVEVEYASEFRYRQAVVEEHDVVAAISQSGETADTLALVKEMKKRGVTVLGICNVVGSSIARETDGGVYIHAGPEIGVASTKAFTSQIVVLALLAVYLGRQRNLTQAEAQRVLRELNRIPDKVDAILERASEAKAIAQMFSHCHNFLYLGRGYNFPVALEGALKLKEISYIHAEGYPAAEMKHGPIALIDESMPVVFIAPKDDITYPKIISNIEEVKARKGKVIVIATEGDELIPKKADIVQYIPGTISCLSPLLSVIPLQLLAYYMAVERGCDVDQPRNLAKSVTVE
jgi:glucosamine--fructose-6-phosphate aminotransferase (isomerizing)